MTKDLTVGSPAKLILGFALPTLFGLLFQQMYNMVDAMIVGRLLGSGALAAVGATGSISFLIIGFCTGVCSGFAIPVAREMGAGEHGRMRRYVANSAYLSVIFALVMTVATGLACRGILTAMDTPEDIFSDAYRYIFIIFMGIPATYLYNLLAGIIRSLGDSRTPVYFLALSSVLNIALDLALILWCGLGVAGAAVATVASQTVSGLACLWYVYRRFPILRLSRAERRADKKLCRDLCVMGVPMGLQFSVTAVGSIILQSAVNGLGSLYVAAAAAGAKIQNLLFSPLDALGAAMATYCGQNVGAAKLDRLGRGVRACVLMGFVYSAGAFAAMQAFAPSCALWFIDPGAAGTGALVALVSRYLRVSTTFFTTLALVVILRMSIQGMGYSLLAIVCVLCLSGGLDMRGSVSDPRVRMLHPPAPAAPGAVSAAAGPADAGERARAQPRPLVRRPGAAAPPPGAPQRGERPAPAPPADRLNMVKMTCRGVLPRQVTLYCLFQHNAQLTLKSSPYPPGLARYSS